MDTLYVVSGAVTFLLTVVAIGALALFIASTFGLISSLFFKGITTLLEDERDNKNTIRLIYPVKTVQLKEFKELNTDDSDSSLGSKRSSSFFEDVDGVDLEYRGVGASEDRRATLAIGAAVSKGK